MLSFDRLGKGCLLRSGRCSHGVFRLVDFAKLFGDYQTFSLGCFGMRLFSVSDTSFRMSKSKWGESETKGFIRLFTEPKLLIPKAWKASKP